ncbi:MAG: TIR domain-containing protein, partial [Pseudomonadota bacterium]
CWIAPRDVTPGRAYGSEIVKGIESARCFVLVLSASSNESQFVALEVERAVSKTKRIFPIRIEPVQPSPGLEFFISSTHWIDCFAGDTKGVERLADLIAQSDMGGSSAGPPPPGKPRPPSGTGRTWGLIGGLAAVLILAGLGGAYFWSTHSPSQTGSAGSLPTEMPAAATAPAPKAAVPVVGGNEGNAQMQADPVGLAQPAPELAPDPAPEPAIVLPRPSIPTETCHRSGGTSYCVSSALPPSRGFGYGPQNLTDGSDQTAWVEGAGGQGISEFVVAEFDAPRMVRGLTIWNGYNKSADIYSKNSRAKDVEIKFSNGESLNAVLEDMPGPQELALDAPIEASWIALVIRDVYPGNKYRDTAINELRVIAN